MHHLQDGEEPSRISSSLIFLANKGDDIIPEEAGHAAGGAWPEDDGSD